MLDMKLIRENPELVKENIRKKFKDAKLPLVDEVIELDARKREVNTRANELRANRNKVSKEIGMLMGKGLRDEAEEKKKLVAINGLDNFIVIDTEDVLLICPKDDRRFKDFIAEIAMPEYEKYR